MLRRGDDYVGSAMDASSGEDGHMLCDELARDTEGQGNWDRAISAVRAVAECYSGDDWRHNAHLWHMDLLAQAGRLDELVSLRADVHARRRLNRQLSEAGHSPLG
ncbi:hypothetical protein EV647_0520 [Kribbella sp. VKM Ac-2566]|nr:hypothetical protein EV647_0520 [Kribbella sp. VKM Ac-2566]